MSEATVGFYQAQVRSPFGTCLNDLSLALVHIIATATTGGVFFQTGVLFSIEKVFLRCQSSVQPSARQMQKTLSVLVGTRKAAAM